MEFQDQPEVSDLLDPEDLLESWVKPVYQDQTDQLVMAEKAATMDQLAPLDPKVIVE